MTEILTRCLHNPVLTRCDIPDIPPHVVDATSVFNPGAVMYEDSHLLLLRVQTRGRETRLIASLRWRLPPWSGC